MKYFALLILIFVTLNVSKSSAQVNEVATESVFPPKLSSDPNHIYEVAEKEPAFPGGLDKLYKFLKDNVKPTGDKGKAYVSFVVEKDGSVSSIQAVRGPSKKAKEEAVGVIKLSPKWKPGLLYGNAVRVYYTVAVNFN